MTAPQPCVRCGLRPAAIRYCDECAKALDEAIAHLADYANSVREERNTLREALTATADALAACQAQLAAKGGGQP